jgi:peroxiredoxin Q/BCP
MVLNQNLLTRWLLPLFFLIALLSGAARAAVPEVGQDAPAFTLPDQDGKAQALNNWRGKWVVLYFYPKDDTPGCTEEACTFRDDWMRLQALGAEVVGVSVDSSGSHATFAQKHKLPFALLSDEKGAVAQSYGALSDWLVMKVAKRYTYLINPQGKIARVYRSVDTSKHSAEIIADLQALQGKR